MATGSLKFQLTVGTLSGEILTSFLADSELSVSEATKLLTELKPPRNGYSYTLVGPHGPMQAGQTLREVLGDSETEHRLTAYTEPVVVLPVAGKPSGVAQLPGSGDLIIATLGFLTEDGAPETPALGQDDGPESRLWIWRVPLSSNYALSEAKLLARKRCWTKEDIDDMFECHVDLFREKRYYGIDRHLDGWTCKGGKEIWTFEELAAAAALDDITKATVPPPKPAWLPAFLHAHDDRYVVVGWNAANGPGNIERFDVETGEIVKLSWVHDLWSVTTDPLDGRIFCSCCYDGWTIQLVTRSTIFDIEKVPDQTVVNAYGEYKAPAPNTIVTFQCGPGFTFDPELRALVAIEKRDPNFLNVICEPDSPELERILALPGAEVVDRQRAEDACHTPGDRTKLWTCVRFRVVAPEDEDPHAAARGYDITRDWLSLSISSRGGQVLHLPDDLLKVRTLNIQGPPEAGGGRVFSADRPITAFAGHFGGAHPLVLIQGAEVPTF